MVVKITNMFWRSCEPGFSWEFCSNGGVLTDSAVPLLGKVFGGTDSASTTGNLFCLRSRRLAFALYVNKDYPGKRENEKAQEAYILLLATIDNASMRAE